ncbi:biotin--[acetyl-CoA-carboxylase] ligase [Oceanispirochaeta crateris]|nr:biotin--[acetyl-CoA-carboxylase] ligase [Oceanispirochaeta crateris]
MNQSSVFSNLQNPFKAPIYYKETSDSTMVDASLLVPTEHGTLTAAGFQSKGKGRGENRIWNSAKDKNLLFTIILNPKQISHPLVRAPLICGLALTKFLNHEYKLNAILKWPNDVLVDNKKVSGILCEYKNNNLLVGLGINCLQMDFPSEIEHKSTSLRLQGVKETPPKILEAFLPILKDTLESSHWKNEAMKYLFGWNKIIEIQTGSVEDSATESIQIVDLTDDGFLVAINTKNNERLTISTGEIRFADFI